MHVQPSRYNIEVKLHRGRALLYNSLSRALCLLEAGEVEGLRTLEERSRAGKVPFDPPLRYLVSQGFVVRDDQDEVKTVRDLYRASRNDPGAVNFIVCSTLSCNFGCDYCFQGAEKPHDAMSPAIQDQAVALFQRIVAAQPDLRQAQMVWYGGEPLMRPQILYDLADRLIDVCAQADIRYSASMVSNGYMLTREVAQQLFLRGLKNVQITLDGAEVDHDVRRHLHSKKGTYEKILGNIRSWIDEIPIMVIVRVNIDERNKDGILRLMDDLEARGLAGRTNLRIYFSPVESNTAACHSVADLTMRKAGYGQLEADLYAYACDKGLADAPYPPRFMGICAALRPNDYIVVPSGDVHKCWDTVSFPEKRVGTVFDTAALFARTSRNHQVWETFDPFENEICRTCKLLPSCSGYCAHKFVYAEDSAGDSILPCPSLKYSLYQRLVLKAVKQGVITTDDYDPAMIVTDPLDLTPKLHTAESMLRPAKARRGLPLFQDA